MHHTMDGAMGIGMALWLIVGLLVLVLLVLGIIWLVRQLQSSPVRGILPAAGSGALREVELRYARGEIDRDTYLAMRDDLRPN